MPCFRRGRSEHLQPTRRPAQRRRDPCPYPRSREVLRFGRGGSGDARAARDAGTARGNASATARGNALANALGNALANALGNASATARGNASATALGNASANALGNALA